jgi:hypothetical protein
MPGRVTFGDFLDGARGHLSSGASSGRVPTGGEDLRDGGRAVRRVILVLARYAQDVASGFGTWSDEPRRQLSAWGQAVADVLDELDHAARHLKLSPASIRTNPGTRPSSGLASRMDQAASQLRTGRELLDTHFESAPDGTRRQHSEWAAAVASPTLRRALLAEIASVAQQVADEVDQAVESPGWRGTLGPRRALNAASHCLRVLGDSVLTAQEHELVPASHRDLLYDMPASILPPRRLPGHEDDIARLRDGVIDSAQRTSRAIWQSTVEPASPSAVTITSLRQMASYAVLTSHHCEILLRAAADKAAIYFPTQDPSHAIGAAVDAAARTRESWLAVARALSHFTTDKRGEVTHATREADGLAMWTGRLAYEDPEWTLTSGPAHEPRSARTLVPALADIPRIVATVHHAIDILEPAADAEHDQARAAAKDGRLLVPTVSQRQADSTQPLTPAPDDRVADLLNEYQVAAQAAADVTAAMSGIAASVASPSRVLTTARAAAGAGRQRHTVRAKPETRRPGLLETSVHDLGVTSPWLVQRAVALDRASEQLILDAAAEPGTGYDGTPAETLGQSASTAAVVRNILESADPRAAALLQPRRPQQELPEREP